MLMEVVREVEEAVPTPCGGPARCVLADAPGLFSEGLEQLLQTCPEVTLVGRATEAGHLAPVVAEHRPDIVLVAFEPTERAIAAAEKLEIPVVLISSDLSCTDFLAALEAGVAAFVNKEIPFEILIASIRRVRYGEQCFPSGWRQALLEAIDDRTLRSRTERLDRLTPREQAVVELVLEGQSNKQIARSLGVAQQTVKNHLHNIMQKAGVTSRVQLCLWSLDPS